MYLSWLVLGLLLSLATATVVLRFERVLLLDARVAFFIPLIVYVSDAVGTQTATIFICNLGKKQAKFKIYIFKEFLLGLTMGVIFGIIAGYIINIWLKDGLLAVAVAIALFASIVSATVFALSIAALLNKLKVDPATSADPVITVFQDVISLLIYFATISLIVS